MTASSTPITLRLEWARSLFDHGDFSAAATAAATGSGTSTVTTCPALTGWFDLAVRPATCTHPSSINRWIWDLECVPRTDARNRSSRRPADSSGTVS